MKQKVQMKFKSQPYIKLCKDLREASGKCGFHIVQNSNQKIDLKKNGLRIRNWFSFKDILYMKEVKKILQETESTEDTLYTMTERTKDHKEGTNAEGVTLPSQ